LGLLYYFEIGATHFELILFGVGDGEMRVVMQRSGGARSHGGRILAGIAFAMACSASSGAFAQANCTSTQTGTTNASSVAFAAGQSMASLSSAISAVETAFLSQQGSAFVSAPANPAPNQPGGGVWIRAVGGEANENSVSNTTQVTTGSSKSAVPGATLASATVNCANTDHITFAGVQLGTDIARLNWNEWNIHWGATAGYLGATSNDTNQLFPSTNTFQVPFLGSYIVATKGRFFADVMVREEMFNINLFNNGLGFANQPLNAHGYSISTSAGYNFDLKNGWFLEPSAGFIYSNTSVDPFTAPGNTINAGIVRTITINDIESELGRLSLRVGKTIETPNVIWQPFASASVLHEFAGDITGSGAAPGSIIFPGPIVVPTNIASQTSLSRVGTYGQYSVGVAGQVLNTGWLGYVRADYKDGQNINGWGGSAGLRYQFTPEMIAPVMPTKVKAPPRPYIAVTDWTGFYVGGVAGADYGRTDVYVNSTPGMGERPWVLGALGGAEVGYNKQFSNWVLGVEGDVVGTNTHGARNPPGFAPLLADTPTPIPVDLGDKTSWIATVTGRVGYAMDRQLYYVKAGAAFENSTVSATCYDPVLNTCTNALVGGLAFPNGSGSSIQTNSTRTGWTLGFGSEFDLGKQWSVKSEINYLSFGSHTALASDGLTLFTDKSYLWQGKIGLNYRFGAPGMVVAKY
jgi:opacity protein-like surface antigen